MEELAEAAAAADGAAHAAVEGAESAEQLSEGTSGKKKQASAVEVGQRNLAAAKATMYAVPGQKRQQSLRKILPWKPFRTLFLPSSWPAPLQHDPVSPARRLTCCPFA